MSRDSIRTPFLTEEVTHPSCGRFFFFFLPSERFLFSFCSSLSDYEGGNQTVVFECCALCKVPGSFKYLGRL